MTARRGLWLGTLVVGVLDILDAFIFFGLRSGAPPTRILQSIAAGVLGRDAAVAGGIPTAALGLALHFVNAFLIVSIFFLAARRWRWLVQHPVAAGVVYGLVVYVVMNYVVVPLSAIATPPRLPAIPVLINGVLIHIFGVGLPTAFIARGVSRRRT